MAAEPLWCSKREPWGKIEAVCVTHMKDGRVLGRIMKIKYCRTEKVLLETGWREPTLFLGE